jgi:Fic family protein
LDVRAVPVTLTNKHTGDIIYTPPQGEAVLRELLSNWDQYLHDESDGLDPLIRMAILHYQFEAIHPFPDGNGRTGRILNVAYLIQCGLLDLPTLYLSRHILKTRGEYYSALERVTTHGEWERWIVYMLTAVETTSYWTTRRIQAIRNLLSETNDYVRSAQLPKSHVRDLVDLIFVQPYCRISNLVDRGIAKRQAASTYLKELVRIGVLRELKSGNEKLFVHTKYMELLSREEHDFTPYERSETLIADTFGAVPKATTIGKKSKSRRP